MGIEYDLYIGFGTPVYIPAIHCQEHKHPIMLFQILIQGSFTGKLEWFVVLILATGRQHKQGGH